MPPDPPADVDWKARLKALGLGRPRRARGTAPPAPARPCAATDRGREGEAAAARHLAENGAVVLARNVRYPVGEIDLVAREGETLLFVEVKRRRDAGRGEGAEAVTPRKRRRIVAAARRWLAGEARPARLVRFDVVALRDEPFRIDWIKGAFDAAS